MSRFQKAVAAVSFSLVLVTIVTALKGSPPAGPPIGSLKGVQEFFTSGTFTVPFGVSHVMVTMWGGGGGGGADTLQAGIDFGAGGGGGGAYTNTVIPVTAGSTYTVTVGTGGAGGVNPGDNGSNGGNSEFALGSTVLAFAGGGPGGTGGTSSAIGVSGSGGQADGTAQISHAGNSGGPICAPGSAYAQNLSPNGSVQPPGQAGPNSSLGFGGSGGNCVNPGSGTNSNGNPGYVLLTF